VGGIGVGGIGMRGIGVVGIGVVGIGVGGIGVGASVGRQSRLYMSRAPQPLGPLHRTHELFVYLVLCQVTLVLGKGYDIDNNV
jgi:hypothetical protein